MTVLKVLITLWIIYIHTNDRGIRKPNGDKPVSDNQPGQFKNCPGFLLPGCKRKEVSMKMITTMMIGIFITLFKKTKTTKKITVAKTDKAAIHPAEFRIRRDYYRGELWF